MYAVKLKADDDDKKVSSGRCTVAYSGSRCGDLADVEGHYHLLMISDQENGRTVVSTWSITREGKNRDLAMYYSAGLSSGGIRLKKN